MNKGMVNKKEQIIIYLICVFLSFLFVRYGIGDMSSASHLLRHYDYNIYYLIGNGWMNEKIPYVGLADIKGPLLFLLHGIGSLLTPKSFLGVSILHSFILGAGMLYAYKTARLFFSVAVSVSVLFLYMIYVADGDGAPAIYALVMEHVTMYHLMLWGKRGCKCFRGIDVVCMGCFVAILLLMKFNMVAFWIPICILVLIVNKWSGLLYLSSGFLSIFIPVICYFYLNDALASMWVEYVETALAYGSSSWADCALFRYGIYWFYHSAPVCIILRDCIYGTILTIAGVIMLLAWIGIWLEKKMEIRRSVLVVLLMSELLIVVANFKGVTIFTHYYYPLYIYCLLSIIVLVRYVGNVLGERKSCYVSICLAVLLHGVFFVYPAVSRMLRPTDEELVQQTVTERMMKRIAEVEERDFLVIDAGQLHYYRLTGKLPHICHFIEPYIPGGRELYRGEQTEYIRTYRPKYVLGSVRSTKEQEEVLNNAGGGYRPISHEELGLPRMPDSKRHRELVLYERMDY